MKGVNVVMNLEDLGTVEPQSAGYSKKK